MRWAAILFIGAAVLTGVNGRTAQASADDPHGLNGTAKALHYNVDAGAATLYTTAATVVKIFLSLLVFVFFGLTLYAGLRWMLARGQQEFIEKSQSTLRNSIIGLIIVLAAYAITNFVFGKLDVAPTALPTGGSPSAPNPGANAPAASGGGTNPVLGCCESIVSGVIASCDDGLTEAACYANTGNRQWMTGSCTTVTACSNLAQVICYPTGGNNCENAPEELCGLADSCSWDTTLKKCIGKIDQTNCRGTTDKNICDLDPMCGWVPAVGLR